MSEMSFSAEIRTVLDHDSGRIKVTAVVVSTTSRNASERDFHQMSRKNSSPPTTIAVWVLAMIGSRVVRGGLYLVGWGMH